MKLKKIGINKYMVERSGEMNVDVMLYLHETLYQQLQDDSEAITQLCDAASLPGVHGRVVGMPDIHTGFGLPIGGVMATARDGLVSAGAVGMDINCGVRLIKTDIPSREVDKNSSRPAERNRKRIPWAGKKSK